MTLNNTFWFAVSWLVRRPVIRDWLMGAVYRRPYAAIGPEENIYMLRGWVFNPYGADKLPRWRWLPSIRVHGIMRPDAGEACHNHPMDARTILLKNGYGEVREPNSHYLRQEGDTYTLNRNDFHRITHLFNSQPVYTLFFIWRVRHGWGFNVDGDYIDRKDFHGKR